MNLSLLTRVSFLLLGFMLLPALSIPGFAAGLDDILAGIRSKNAYAEKGIKDLTLVQEISNAQDKESGTATIKMFKKGGKFRTEMDMGEFKMLTIYDGNDFWSVNPILGKMKLSGAEANRQKQQADWWDTFGNTMKLSGTEMLNGRECYVLENTAADNPFSRVWIDTRNFNMLQADLRDARGKNVERIIYSDFRKIKGDIEIPFKSETFRKGRPEGTVTVRSFTVNTGLSDDLFSADKIEIKKEKPAQPEPEAAAKEKKREAPNPMDGVKKGLMRGIMNR